MISQIHLLTLFLIGKSQRLVRKCQYVPPGGEEGGTGGDEDGLTLLIG